MRRLDQETHRETCPQTRPFQLAGHTYSLQPGTNALVYQRTDEAPLHSHVCIPVTTTALLEWLIGDPAALEWQMRVDCKQYFRFQLTGHNYRCRFPRYTQKEKQQGTIAGFKFTGVDHQDETNTFKILILDDRGRKLWYRSDSWDTREFKYTFNDDYIPESSLEKAAEALDNLPKNRTAYLVISLQCYRTLFGQPAPERKRAPPGETDPGAKRNTKKR